MKKENTRSIMIDETSLLSDYSGADKIQSLVFFGTPSLMWESNLGDLARVKKLIKDGVELNRVDNDGNTALMYASRRGHTKIVQLLLEHGADLNIKNNDGLSALDIAIKEKQEGCVRVLNEALIAQKIVKT